MKKRVIRPGKRKRRIRVLACVEIVQLGESKITVAGVREIEYRIAKIDVRLEEPVLMKTTLAVVRTYGVQDRQDRYASVIASSTGT